MRLNRGGNRQADAALYRVAIVRMRDHAETGPSAARRTAEGKTCREILRCNKRYIVREVFAPCAGRNRPHCPLDGYRSFNASVESVFTSLKAGLVWRQTWQSRREVEFAVLEYICGF